MLFRAEDFLEDGPIPKAGSAPQRLLHCATQIVPWCGSGAIWCSSPTGLWSDITRGAVCIRREMAGVRKTALTSLVGLQRLGVKIKSLLKKNF